MRVYISSTIDTIYLYQLAVFLIKQLPLSIRITGYHPLDTNERNTLDCISTGCSSEQSRLYIQDYGGSLSLQPILSQVNLIYRGGYFSFRRRFMKKREDYLKSKR